MGTPNKTNQAEALKKLMGPGWSGKLMNKTGLTRQAVCKMVNKMNTTNENWPYVMDLARKNKQTLSEIEQLITA